MRFLLFSWALVLGSLQYPMISRSNSFIVLLKSSDYQEDAHYDQLIKVLKPYGQILMSGEENLAAFDNVTIVAVGSSSYAAQQEIYE